MDKQEFGKYAEETMEFVKLIEADGCRLPGSDEEKAAAKKIQAEITKKTGLTPKTEKFTYAPAASIGMINYLGWAALAFLVLYYINMAFWLSLVGYVGILVFTFCQIVRYTGIFDIFFKKATADNIITELQPRSGKTSFTIYLGAHYDSSWCWKLAAKNPDSALIKTGYGIVGILVMIALCLIKAIRYFAYFEALYNMATEIVLVVLPLLLIPGFLWVTQFTSQDKTIGSPGAMDNLSGIGLNMMIMKHFSEHPEELPEGCKLVDICFASEEAGLKGSSAYVDAHKDDKELRTAYVINIDSVADPDHFEAIVGDTWQGTKFDKKLIDMTTEAMKESGIANPGKIYNPVGGCDSTPFCKIGVPTLTIAAQNPKSTEYYHTYKDTSARIDVSTFATGYEVIYRLIKKICDDETKAAKSADEKAE